MNSGLPDEAAGRTAVQSYLVRAVDAPGESARSRLLAALIQQLCDARLDYIEDRAPDADAFVRVRGKDRVVLGQPGQAYGSAILVFQDDLGRSGRADEARLLLRRYLACLWSTEPVGQRRNYLCLATDGFRLDVSTPLAPEPGRPTIVPGEIGLKRLTLMDLRAVSPADLSAWLDRCLCRRRPIAATPANFLADFGASSHAWQTVCPELTRLWSRLASRPDCQEAFEAWRASTATSIPYGEAAQRFVIHAYLAMVARLLLLARLNPAATPGSAATALPALDGSAAAAMGIHGLVNWPLLTWTALPEAGDAAALVAVSLAGLLPAYTAGDGHAEALDALCASMCDTAYRQVETTPAWLANRIVDRLYTQTPDATLADPACGHGAFLRAAAAQRRANGAGVAAVLSGLAGLERDPLAATVAQVGLLLSAGDLSARPPGPVTVPVHWAASSGPAAAARLPGRQGQPGAAGTPTLTVAGHGVRIPVTLIADQALSRRCLQALWPLVSESAGRDSPPAESAVGAYLWLHHPALAREQDLRADLLELVRELHASGMAARGAAGLFDLLAALPVLFWGGHFDAAIARPRLAARITDPPQQPESAIGAAWEMVREGGSVACVLPRAALGGRQFERLRGGVLSGSRAGKGARLRWWELWDLEEEVPPDAKPLCVFFGERLPAGGQPCTEAPGLVLSCTLPVEGSAPAVAGRPVRFTLARQRRGTAWSTESIHQPELGL